MLENIRRFLNTNIAFLVILIVIIFCLYGKAINYELLSLDDTISITNNISYISDIHNLPKLFFQDCAYGNTIAYYRPILMMSYSIETIFFGYNVQIYHLTNIILYIFTFYLIYYLFIKLKLNKTISKLVVCFFAIHPILTSNVVYVSPRAEMFLSIFIVLSFINFIEYIQTNKTCNVVLSTIFFLLALFSKETAIIFIPLCLLLPYVFDYNINKKYLKINIICLLGASILYFICRKISVPNTDYMYIVCNLKVIAVNMFKSLMLYTEKLCVPEYIPVLLYNINVSFNMIVINSIVLLLVLFLYFKNIVDRKKIVFCFLWYTLFLFPTFLIVKQQIFFHRLLLPCIAIEIFIILFIQKILDKNKIIKKYLIFFYVVIFVTFIYASFLQADKYSTQETFIINSYIDSANVISYNQLIGFYIKKGDLKKARSILDELSKEELTYRYMLYYIDIEFYEGNIDKCEQQCLSFLKLLENENVYVRLAQIYMIRKDYNKAEEYIRKAYSLKPYNTYVLEQMALLYEKKGKYQESLDIYNNLLQIDRQNKSYNDKISELNKKNIN